MIEYKIRLIYEDNVPELMERFRKEEIERLRTLIDSVNELNNRNIQEVLVCQLKRFETATTKQLLEMFLFDRLYTYEKNR